MKIKPLVTAFLIIISMVAGVSCIEIPTGLDANRSSLKFHHNFEAAAAESRETGKPIVTIFSASWCPPCQVMKKQVYPSTDVQPFHDQFVWAYLDADSPRNQNLMNQNHVEGIPHVAFIAPNGVTLGQTVGAMGSREFAGVLQNVLSR